MTLAVHCKLVNHEFREHIHTQKTTSVSIDQRKKMLTSTLPIICYSCQRTSEHADIREFTNHVIEKHLNKPPGNARSEKKKRNQVGQTMSEADLCRSLERIPPTMLDINRQKCRLCDKEMKKTSDFRKHILSHAQIPQFRCRFCKQGSIFTAQKREQMFQHIRSCHEKVMTNGETEKSVLEKCRVNPKVLWDAYGITCD